MQKTVHTEPNWLSSFIIVVQELQQPSPKGKALYMPLHLVYMAEYESLKQSDRLGWAYFGLFIGWMVIITMQTYSFLWTPKIQD